MGKKEGGFGRCMFNGGCRMGGVIGGVSIGGVGRYLKSIGVGKGWEMGFMVIGGVGFMWMGVWMLM